MTQTEKGPILTDIRLHKKTRVLDVCFDDGKAYQLPCHYLRSYSPSAEVQAARNRGESILAPEDVNIDEIEPVGSYAVRLVFSDGHDSGVFSWSTLYQLGESLDENWPPKDVAIETESHTVVAPDTDVSKWIPLQLYYFGVLVDQIERDREEVKVPQRIQDVRALVDWLSERGVYWETALKKNQVKITVNRQFAGFDTPIKADDEVAFVP